MSVDQVREALLVLADGTTFEGEAIGAEPPGGVASGEVVFNTVLSGYQEVITDPSYAGQIITFTYPHIGNYGVTAADDESRRPFCRGVIVRELARRRSNWRSDGDLDAFLRRHGVPGIAGIDTRRLTRHLREAGAMPGAFGTADEVDAQGGRGPAEPGTDGVDLVAEVTTPTPYTVGDGPLPGRRLRLRHQGHDPAPPRRGSPRSRSCRRPRRPPRCWPGGPTACSCPTAPATRPRCRYAVEAIARAARRGVPVFGICLGHQLLGHGPRRPTPCKLPFGHHGGNHPVQHLADRPGRDHQPEPQLRRRRRLARRPAPRSPTSTSTTACRGPALPRRAGLQRAVPPRGRPRPPRQPLPVRRLRRPAARPDRLHCDRHRAALMPRGPRCRGGRPRVDPAHRVAGRS